MNQRENFLARLKREGSEYTPVFLRDLTLGLDATGLKTTDVAGEDYNAEESARSVLALQNIIGHDAVVGCISTYGRSTLGGKTKFPEYGIPHVVTHPFEDISKMEHHHPSEIYDTLLKGTKKSYSLVRQKAPELAVVLNTGGPVTVAGGLRGLEQFMLDIHTEPKIAHDLMKFGEGMIKIMIETLYEHSDVVFLASASDNPDMIGPDVFREISLGSVKKITDFTHDLGLPVIFHPHGVFSTEDRTDILKGSIDTGIEGFQFAEGNEPEGILEQTKGRCSILGGVDIATTLLLGPEDRIKRDTLRYLDACKDGDHILMCSCSLHRGIPINNVKTMVDTVREFDNSM